MQLKSLGGILGLLQREPLAFLQGEAAADGLDDAAINTQIAARIAAKQAKNFAEADRIRKELLEAESYWKTPAGYNLAACLIM